MTWFADLGVLIEHFLFWGVIVCDLVCRFGCSNCACPVLQTLNLTFSFEDLLYEEISWKTLETEFFPQPHLAPVTEGEAWHDLFQDNTATAQPAAVLDQETL